MKQDEMKAIEAQLEREVAELQTLEQDLRKAAHAVARHRENMMHQRAWFLQQLRTTDGP